MEPQANQQQSKSQNPMDKMIGLLNSLPKKLAELPKTLKSKQASAAAQAQTTISSTTISTPIKIGSKFNLKKIAIAGGAVFAILIILSVIPKLLPRGNGATPPPFGAPSNTPGFVLPTKPPTRYASDQQIIEIEQSIIKLDEDLRKVDLDETNLLPRPLDFDITFR